MKPKINTQHSYEFITNPNPKLYGIKISTYRKSVVINLWSTIIRRTDKGSNQALVITKTHDKSGKRK